MLAFKVYAGTIFCGRLYVIPGVSHTFINVSNNYVSGYFPISKVMNYKNVRLVRYI